MQPTFKITALLLMIFSGFASSASAADQLVYPIDVVSDEKGTIYIADLKLPGIWKYADKKLSVFHQASKKFRTPLNAVRCIAVDSDGTVFAGDSATREVYRFDEDGQPTPLTEGRIGIASDLLIDGKTIVVSDLETQRIWSVPVEGGKPKEIVVVAGVRGLALANDSQLLILTTNANQLRRMEKDGSSTVLQKGRPFQFPHQLAILGESMFVSDNYANAIWKLANDGSGTPEKFKTGKPMVKPVGLGVSGKNLLIADPHAKDVFLLKPDGSIQSVFDSPKE